MAETIKIQKIKVAGQVIYPATILDAVKDASVKIKNAEGQDIDNPSYGKTLREIIVDNEKVTAESLNELDGRAGKLADLSTTAKSSLVAAINEVASSASGATGDLTTLTTDAKTSAVAAINEVDAHADAANAAIATLNGDANTAGSVDAKVAALKKEIMTGEATGTVAEAYDTLKEVADWISANDANGEATGLTKQVAANTTAIGAANTAAEGEASNATGLYKEIEDAIDAASHAKTTVVTGTGNGTVAVDGTDVAVKGLGSAAYTDATAYDASGAAATAEQNAKNYADGLATNYDAAGAASTAELNAKDYADGLATNYDEAGAAAAVQGNTTKTVKDLVDEIGEEGVAESVDGAGDGKAATGIYAKIDAAKAAAIAAQHSKTTVAAGTANGTISVDGEADVTIYAPVTAAPSSTATDAQLATAKGVYDYALTAEATSDTTDYADVF